MRVGATGWCTRGARPFSWGIYSSEDRHFSSSADNLAKMKVMACLPRCFGGKDKRRSGEKEHNDVYNDNRNHIHRKLSDYFTQNVSVFWTGWSCWDGVWEGKEHLRLQLHLATQTIAVLQAPCTAHCWQLAGWSEIWAHMLLTARITAHQLDTYIHAHAQFPPKGGITVTIVD